MFHALPPELVGENASPRKRASVSVLPLSAKGTMIVTGRDGCAWAAARWETASVGTTATVESRQRRRSSAVIVLVQSD
jgi:hypothetical protein